MSSVHVLASLIKTIMRRCNKKTSSSVLITESNSKSKVEVESSNVKRLEKGRIHFMGLYSSHENQVYIIIYEDNTVEVYCYTDGYSAANGQRGGVYCAGGCSYAFPIEESLEYLNVAAFIREKTWISNDFDSIITREDFEKQLNELYYTE